MFEHLGIVELMIFILPVSLFAILWVVALVDIMKNNLQLINRIRWILVITFFPIVGAVLYFIYGKDKKMAAL